MLLRCNTRLPLPESKLRRLLALEDRLRLASYGSISVALYADELKRQSLPIVSQRTLHEDLAQYSAMCDDLVYGEKRKRVTIDPLPSRDALAFFFGYGAQNWPFSPAIYSATLRTIMLARELKLAIEYTYCPWFEREDMCFASGSSFCLPLRIIRGTDTVYAIVFDLRAQKRLTLNLARMAPQVACLTENDIKDKKQIPQEARFPCFASSPAWTQSSKLRRIIVEARNLRAFRFALKQFPRLQRTSQRTATLDVEDEVAQLAVDTLAAFFDRLHRRGRTVAPYRNDACSIYLE